MKSLIINRIILSSFLLFAFASTSYANQFNTTEAHQQAKQQYLQYVENGKTFKDAYAALAYEIAFEKSSVQAKSPCRKMVRGL